MIKRYTEKYNQIFARILVLSFLYGSLSHGLQYLTIPHRDFCQSYNRIINNTLKVRFTSSLEKFLEKEYFVTVPQWKLLNRANMISFENNFVLCQLTKLNRVLLRPIPIWEFRDIIKCLENSGRSRDPYSQIISKLNTRPRKQRHLPDDYLTTAPAIWLDLLKKLPSYLMCHLGTKTSSKNIIQFFTALCQHNEKKNEICENCQLNKRAHRDQGYKDITNKNLRTGAYTIDGDFYTISRQFIIESDHMNNIFYRAIANKSTWFNNTVDTTNANFDLIGPTID